MKAQPGTNHSAEHAPAASASGVATYEERLEREPRWALTEGSQFFEGKGAVQESLRRITHRLDELGIAYAVSGGLALFAHGYRRFTEDVDLLVAPEGLRRIHKELDGLGYVPPFTGSKNLRDTQSGVKIEFLVSGQFPGDGKPKPVAFPFPASVAVEKDGIKYLSLPALIELKLASGMTNADRMKDLSDVMELTKLLDLPKEFSEQLAPFVKDKYLEIWQLSHRTPKRYVQIWRNKFLALDAKTLEEMIGTLRDAVKTLEAMRADGVILDPKGGTGDDYAYLVTLDPAIAKKYGMHDESEFWEDEVTEGEENSEAGELPKP